MELWTRAEGELCWKEWPDALQGIAALRGLPAKEVLLLTLRPDEEAAELLAAVRLIHETRETGGAPVRVIVGSPHPSDDWVAPLREAGIDQVWWVVPPGGPRGRGRCSPGPAASVGQQVCPALHAGTEGGTSLSLCGRHDDRMVLGSGHLERWCLRRHRECPHWKLGPGAWFGEEG